MLDALRRRRLYFDALLCAGQATNTQLLTIIMNVVVVVVAIVGVRCALSRRTRRKYVLSFEYCVT